MVDINKPKIVKSYVPLHRSTTLKRKKIITVVTNKKRGGYQFIFYPLKVIKFLYF